MNGNDDNITFKFYLFIIKGVLYPGMPEFYFFKYQDIFII